MEEDDREPPRIRLTNAEFRYVQVADDLEARIRAGEFPFDSLLPRREDVAAEYGVGEMTVRHALRELAARGMVRPMPSVGTVVIWTGHNGAHGNG
jgi:GntR family transcriptional regulator